MDYMKVLLIYMAATLSLAVQSTTAPEMETPAPPEPTAIVETVTDAQQTAQIIDGEKLTPGPATPTPAPVPEITPNRRYRNLGQGARGSEVRRLQEKLIELGYLKEGSADGAYGRQTAAAVKQFQKNNGLTADGIAGKRTQTYLYENPDIVSNNPVTPAPTDPPAEATPEITPETTAEEIPTAEPTEEPTEAPTEAPTAAPTEAPTATPTAEPTEAPTEAPTETPTEAPTATPTAEPTEEPTEAPTEAPTAIPTAEPTEAPTETPTAAPTSTPGAPVTSAPATETPIAEPTMFIEEIDLNGDFVDVKGSVAYNESGAPLEWTVVEDGVRKTSKPRLQEQEGRIRVSLDDLSACLEGWNLTDDGTVVLEAEGHTLGLYNEDAGPAATVDGTEIPIASDDFVFGEGHFISAEFLARMLGGEAEWDAEESTLMLRFPKKKGE